MVRRENNYGKNNNVKVTYSDREMNGSKSTLINADQRLSYSIEELKRLRSSTTSLSMPKSKVCVIAVPTYPCYYARPFRRIRNVDSIDRFSFISMHVRYASEIRDDDVEKQETKERTLKM